jgi:hypothetical protein
MCGCSQKPTCGFYSDPDELVPLLTSSIPKGQLTIIYRRATEQRQLDATQRNSVMHDKTDYDFIETRNRDQWRELVICVAV